MEGDNMISFELLNAAEKSGPRIGSLTLRNRKPMQTPTFFGNTSRGAVPHISQDIQRDHTEIGGLYMAFEDFAEKAPPQIAPILQCPTSAKHSSRLRFFTAQNDSTVLVLGTRRLPPVETPFANSNTSFAICTSIGFRTLDVDEFIEAAEALQPDIVLSLADVPALAGDFIASAKRKERMTDRTTQWLKYIITRKIELGEDEEAESPQMPAIFAPVLPISAEAQSWYLRELYDADLLQHISGLAIHDAQILPDVADSLSHLPRLSVSRPKTPHQVLTEISLGIDAFILPFINTASDQGLIFAFTFPAQRKTENGQVPHETPVEINGNGADHTINSSTTSLADDAWHSDNATSVAPLVPGCQCHACTNYHRAYLHHLLQAKEMLAWVLLQIHNHHVMHQFFAGVRQSIRDGTFIQDQAEFERGYEEEFPTTTGQGPRVRGYQMKSKGGGEPKKNRKAYNHINDTKEALAEAVVEDNAVPSNNVSGQDLEDHGMGKLKIGP